MLSFLRQPYPIGEPELKKAIFQSGMVGLFVAFVLIVFQPFGSYNWHHPYKNLTLLGYGGVASATTFLNFFAGYKLFPSLFEEKHWTVGKEIAWNLFPCLLGGFLSAVYGYFTGAMPFTLIQVTTMIIIVFLVGLFPAIIMVLLNYTYLIRKYRPTAGVEQRNTATLLQNEPAVELIADNEKDKLVILPDDLLYIEASDNYCTVFYMSRQKITRTLLRSSLSRLESQISSPHIRRVHRSYIANFNRINHVSGNAQGYKLHFEQVENTVPVARSYAALLKAFLLPG